MHVVICPDSFKGSATAAQAAQSLRQGWLRARPADRVTVIPMADGGEGTLAAVKQSVPGTTERVVRVLGPGGPLVAPWLLCPDGTAIVELAAASGLPLLPKPNPLGAHTFGFGQLLADAASHRDVRRIVATLGGSASTDGGSGALTALGVRFYGPSGLRIPLGGGHLSGLIRTDLSRLLPAPVDGVEVLVDVDAPLIGPNGAAHQFAPQKGANPDQVATLDAALQHLAHVLGHDPATPGSGAAGGTAYGLAALWTAKLTPGAQAIGKLTGLHDAVADADLIITGEGRLDSPSFRSKVVGHVAELAAAAGVPVWACVGQQDTSDTKNLHGCTSLSELAGSAQAALAEPTRWLEAAGQHVTTSWPHHRSERATA
ncbi:glycerate kinase [Phycicoccus sp. Soil803]|uniref:glycerate kinase n=1 Tax=Phycicoccus sp. Soil803 TaxID=1736415 RepID=UPI0012F7F9B0|nr:glycerate kinase [Phycicoccus sp. Soil803]